VEKLCAEIKRLALFFQYFGIENSVDEPTAAT